MRNLSDISELDGVPASRNNDDSDLLQDIGRWISSNHPQRCHANLDSLFASHKIKYSVTIQELVSHCIEKHDDGIWTIVKMCQSYFPSGGPEIANLVHSIEINQERLLKEIVAEWTSLETRREGHAAVFLIADSLDDSHFESLWEFVWNNGLAESGPKLGGIVFKVAAFSTVKSKYTIRLIEQHADKIPQPILNEFVYSLVLSPQLLSIRDEQLDLLLNRHGVNAAKLIVIHSQYAKDIPSCISKATKIILSAEPEDLTAPIGIGLCLRVDPNFAIPIIVEWVNTGKSRQHYDQFLREKVKEEVSSQRGLFRALAEDTVRRDPVWHRTLAQIHQNLMQNAEHAVEWIGENIDNPSALRYSASLVVAYLSETRSPTTPELTKKLMELGHRLHDKYGSRDVKSVLQEANLTDPNLNAYEELVAIALAKDVALPARKMDVEKALETIKKLPSTYAALGGPQLDAEMSKGNLPPFAAYYVSDPEVELASLTERLKSGQIEPLEFRLAADFPNSVLNFRTSWEKIFSKILKVGINLPTRRLQTDVNVWSEMRILAQLVDYFSVSYEPPNISGIKPKRPDFILKSDYGDVIFEVATVDTKPDDVREAVTISTGGTIKKTLQNKLREKFNECKGCFDLPAVIAVQTRWGSMDEYDCLNSLYGPQQANVAWDKESKEIVEEGSSRGVEKGFFSQSNVDCISAVVRIEPNDSYARNLVGDIYRPINPPRYSLNAKLWVRLRDALFGSMPKRLVEEMSKIPSISSTEAETLVRYGVDDHSFFAGGLIGLPEGLPMGSERFEELRGMAKKLCLLQRTGRIAYLYSAQEVDLAPLNSEGIYTISQLLKSTQRPSDISESDWDAMRDEATKIMKRAVN